MADHRPNLADTNVIATMETVLFENNTVLYYKMKYAIDQFKKMQGNSWISEEEERILEEGGALMYHLMTNPEFCNDFKS